jgi:hypothetical protein
MRDGESEFKRLIESWGPRLVDVQLYSRKIMDGVRVGFRGGSSILIQQRTLKIFALLSEAAGLTQVAAFGFHDLSTEGFARDIKDKMGDLGSSSARPGSPNRACPCIPDSKTPTGVAELPLTTMAVQAFRSDDDRGKQ